MDPQLRSEVRSLTTRLGAMVREQAGEEIFQRVESLRRLSKALRENGQDAEESGTALRKQVKSLKEPDAYLVAHAFSLFFQCVNLCEERARVRHLAGHAEPAQSLKGLFRELKTAGVSGAQLQTCLNALEVEPVLTAHPTEAKRRTMLDQIFRLAEHIDAPDEILEALWQTEEVREHKVTPLDELRNALFFVERTIMDTLARFYATFDAELAAVYPGVTRTTPFLTFASWVGGDRDGNPFVTPEISLEAGKLHHERAEDFIRVPPERLAGREREDARRRKRPRERLAQRPAHLTLLEPRLGECSPASRRSGRGPAHERPRAPLPRPRRAPSPAGRSRPRLSAPVAHASARTPTPLQSRPPRAAARPSRRAGSARRAPRLPSRVTGLHCHPKDRRDEPAMTSGTAGHFFGGGGCLLSFKRQRRSRGHNGVGSKPGRYAHGEAMSVCYVDAAAYQASRGLGPSASSSSAWATRSSRLDKAMTSSRGCSRGPVIRLQKNVRHPNGRSA